MAKKKQPKVIEPPTEQPTTNSEAPPTPVLNNPSEEQPPEKKKEKPIDVTAIAEFVPYKHYQCSVWRTDEGNVFIKRAQKGVGGNGLKKIFSEGQFSYEASKKKMRLVITIDKPSNFNQFFDMLSAEVNKAILAFHKNKVIDLIK